MRFKFEYYEVSGNTITLNEEQSQKVKDYMDDHDTTFEQAYWDLVDMGEMPDPWELCDINFIESEINFLGEEE